MLKGYTRGNWVNLGGMAVHTYNTNTRQLHQADHDFEVSLGFIETVAK